MFRKIPSVVTRFLMVTALVAGVVGAMIPVGKASATNSGFLVSLTDARAGTASQYSFTVNSPSPIPAAAQTWTIVFPAGTTVPATAALAAALTATTNVKVSYAQLVTGVALAATGSDGSFCPPTVVCWVSKTYTYPIAAITSPAAQTVAIVTPALVAAPAGVVWLGSYTNPTTAPAGGIAVPLGTNGFAAATITLGANLAILNPAGVVATNTLTVANTTIGAADAAVGTSYQYPTGLTNTNSVAITPDSAGTNSQYAIAWTNTATLTSGSGTITVNFPRGTTVPASIPPSAITINGISDCVSTTGGAACPNAGTAVTGIPLTIAPAINLTPSGSVPGTQQPGTAVGLGSTVTITIPNMNPQTSPLAIGNLLAGAATVTFSGAAGIVTPLAQSSATNAQISIGTSTAASGAPGATAFPATFATVTLAPVSGGRNATVTAVGRGFTAGTTATVYLDTNALSIGPVNAVGILPLPAGTSAATATYVSNYTGLALTAGTIGTVGTIATFNAGASLPTLNTGTIGADATFTTTFPAGVSFPSGPVFINAIDGVGRVVRGATVFGNGEPFFTLFGGVRVTPPTSSTVTVGQTVSFDLINWTAGATLTLFTLGGFNMLPAALVTAAAPAANGVNVSFTTTIPASAAPGAQLAVFGVTTGGIQVTGAVPLVVAGAPLTISPSGNLVANQTISIQASGFTPGGTIATAAGINFAGSIANAATGLQITNTFPIALDSGGNLVLQAILPTTGAVVTAGQYTLTITDAAGRTGTSNITIATPVLTSTPSTSPRGTVVALKGTGFTASSSGQINYVSGAVTTSIQFVTTDANGNFTVNAQIPTTATAAPIPSNNSLQAVMGTGASTITASAAHNIPSASITIANATVAPGQTLSITGINFPAFSSVTNVTVGGLSALPIPAPSTDANGNVTVSVLVPQVPIGTNPLVLQVGGIAGTSASASLNITTAPTTVQSSLAPLISAGNLVRVWGFNSATQKFQLYDPAALPASDLQTLSVGAGYWINVKTAATVTLSLNTYNLVAGWNLIGWLG